MEECENTSTVVECPAPEAPRRGYNVLGIVGFALSIQGLSLCWYPFLGVGSSIAGWIICHMANKRPDKRFAGKGLVMSIIGTVLGVILTVLFLLFPFFNW